MNKAELIAEVAKSLETKVQAKAAIDSMINNIAGAMKRKEDIGARQESCHLSHELSCLL